jgi:trafficking protein particle complex subunit 11
VGEPAAFQLTMTAPTSISIALIPFSRLTLDLSNDSSIVVHHAPSDVQLPIQRVVIGHAAGQEPLNAVANLRWQPEGTIIFTGSISSEVPLVLKVGRCVLSSFVKNVLKFMCVRLLPSYSL